MTPQFQTAQPTITRAGFLDGLERLKAQADRDRMIVRGSYRDVTAAIRTGAFVPRGR